MRVITGTCANACEGKERGISRDLSCFLSLATTPWPTARRHRDLRGGFVVPRDVVEEAMEPDVCGRVKVDLLDHRRDPHRGLVLAYLERALWGRRDSISARSAIEAAVATIVRVPHPGADDRVLRARQAVTERRGVPSDAGLCLRVLTGGEPDETISRTESLVRTTCDHKDAKPEGKRPGSLSGASCVGTAAGCIIGEQRTSPAAAGVCLRVQRSRSHPASDPGVNESSATRASERICPGVRGTF